MSEMMSEKVVFEGQRSRVSGLVYGSAASCASCLAVLLSLFVSSSFAGEFIVSSAAQIAQVMATAQPGDTLTMTNGLWTNQQILFQGSGTNGNPIVLRARSYGFVTLSGTSKLKIAGNYLIAENLVFQNGNSAPNPVVEFRNGSTESNYCRLTNSAISNYSPSDINTDNKWVSLYGTYNRVDHCSLVGKTNSGTTLVVWLTNHPNYHLIDRNYFGPRPNLGFNGGETIRVGTSDWATYQSFTTVEYNLFDQCNGEAEIISSKSRRNMYRYNTFTSCQGTLTLRHGDSCTVEGNFFLGNGVPNSGGIRIIGEDQTVINNYVAGTTGDGLRSALSLMNGIPNSPAPLYFQVKRAVVAFNTFVDNQTTFTIGAGADTQLTLPPLDCTIANNVLYGTHSPLITEDAVPINMTYQGNIYYGAALGISSSGFLNVDPRLAAVGGDGLRHINNNSPAINASVGTYPLVVMDMDGQPRDSQKDIGADEFSAATITRRPLTQADVGPNSGTTYTITATAGANGTISPSGAVTVSYGANQAFAVAPSTGYQVDSLLVDDVVVDSTTSYTFTNVTTTHTIRAVFRPTIATLNVALTSDWNLISNPVMDPIPGDSVRQMYPTSMNPYAFEFSGGYVQSYRLVNGKGYWEKFPAAISQSVTGTERTRDSISVVTGWNIIGTISNTVDTSTIVSVPPGLRASQWFGYVGGYTPVTQLIPGKGYWLKSNAAGKFVLANPLVAGPAKVQASGESALDGLNTLTITDSRGGSQTLYFGADAKNEIQVPMFVMPPAPPAGALDARFSATGGSASGGETHDGGSMVQTHAAETSEPVEFSVAVQSDAYPLTVSWKVNGAASYELTDGRGGEMFRTKEMRGEGTMKITSSSVSRFSIRLVGDGQLPKAFALEQNYPNPFNPTTTIRYGLPRTSFVKITVVNTLGQRVAQLADEQQEAGYHSVVFRGEGLASGVYFCTLQTGDFVASKKLLLLK